MIGKGYSDSGPPQPMISEDRLSALSAQSEERFGLSENRRRAAFRAVVAAEDRGTNDAMAQVPDSEVMKLGEQIYAELTAAGIDVILDDRDDRPGVKFKDADLVGFPIRIAIGEKSLAKGEIEVKVRGAELVAVAKEQAVPHVLQLLR